MFHIYQDVQSEFSCVLLACRNKFEVLAYASRFVKNNGAQSGGSTFDVSIGAGHLTLDGHSAVHLSNFDSDGLGVIFLRLILSANVPSREHH